MSRVCNKCKRELPVSDFYAVGFGIRYICKKCESIYWRAYLQTHLESKRKYEKEYATKNPGRRWVTGCLAGHRRKGYSIEIGSAELFQMASKTDTCFIC